MSSVIVGCGDIGRRIIQQMMVRPEQKTDVVNIFACTRSERSMAKISDIGVQGQILDLDLQQSQTLPQQINQADVYYLVPPQKNGVTDLRSRAAIEMMTRQRLFPRKVVLISTTGVYGDCLGEWVTEERTPDPQTQRGQRRLDSEQQWRNFCDSNSIEINILRCPGIYAFSRIPRQRIESGAPVVRAEECGFTNRIHADDLAATAITAMSHSCHGEIFNVTDGRPGTITEYLQAACAVLNLPSLPEISMDQAKLELSEGMLSYLSESRRISNRKMLEMLKMKQTYPDFRVGLRH